MSVNPIPVNKPISNPFSFPFIPATIPPINNVINPAISDMYAIVSSAIAENRIIKANKKEDISNIIIIAIQPYTTADKNDLCKLSLL